MHGKTGRTLRVDVPPGTIVYDDATGEPLADLTDTGAEFVVARGGKGGLGNPAFQELDPPDSARSPSLGEPGEERGSASSCGSSPTLAWSGCPNAGKKHAPGRLVRAPNRRSPTTPSPRSQPNLGVVALGGIGGQTFVMADVPGLIEGAAAGLGSRSRVPAPHPPGRRRWSTCSMPRADSRDATRSPISRRSTPNCSDYDPDLIERPMVVVLNKIDIPEAQANLPRLREHLSNGNHETVRDLGSDRRGRASRCSTGSARSCARSPRGRRAVEPEIRTYSLADLDEKAFRSSGWARPGSK